MNIRHKLATPVAALFVALTAGSSWAVCDPATTIAVPTEIPTIQAAVAAAGAGQTVCINAGKYNENVCVTGDNTCDNANILGNIKVPITITGDPAVSREQVIINGLNGPAATPGSGPGLTLSGDGHTVTNLIVRNTFTDPVNNKTGIGIVAAGDNITLDDIAVNKAGSFTPPLDGSCVIIVGNNATVTNSQLKGCDSLGLLVLGNTARIANNQIRNNTVGNIIQFGANAEISANRSQDTLLFNIVSLGDSNTIADNITRTSLGFGVLAASIGGSMNVLRNDVGIHTLIPMGVIGPDPRVEANTVQSGVIAGLVACTTGCGTGVGTTGNAFNRASVAGLVTIALAGGYKVDQNAALANGAIGIGVVQNNGFVRGNATDTNGFALLGASGASNLLVAGAGNRVSDNLSIRAGADGIVLQDLTPDGGNEFTNNVAIRSVRKGFNVGNNNISNTPLGNGNSFTGDIALVNRAEGFANFDFATAFTGIQSSGNFVDCANDCRAGDPFIPGCALGSTAIGANLQCADGSNFTVPNTINFN